MSKATLGIIIASLYFALPPVHFAPCMFAPGTFSFIVQVSKLILFMESWNDS